MLVRGEKGNEISRMDERKVDGDKKNEVRLRKRMKKRDSQRKRRKSRDGRHGEDWRRWSDLIQ